MTDETTQQLGIWGWLTKSEQKLLLLAASVEAVPKGKVLFHEGEKGDRVGVLVTGRLLIVQPVAGHEDLVLHVVRPGELFGETLLAETSPVHEYRTETVEDSTVALIPTPLFSEIMKGNPLVASYLFRLALERKREAERRLLDVRYQTVEYRIRKLFREIMVAEGRQLMNGEIELPMRLSHRLIAQLCVTSRQSVTILLLNLKKQSIIRYNRHHMVVRQPGVL